jgi:hypothetical protein
MRFVVFALIFANLLFFAYAQGYFGESVAPEAQHRALRLQAQAQDHPERLRLLGQAGEVAPPPESPLESPPPLSDAPATPNAVDRTPAPLPEKPPVVKAPEVAPPPAPPPPAPPAPPVTRPSPPALPEKPGAASVCMLFSVPRPEIATQLTERATNAGLRVSSRNDGSWWVFIPPQPDRNAAVKKASELRALGVTEFFIVNDGPQQFALSLGVFSREEAAKTHLEKLRDKGVKSARTGPRYTDKARQVLEVRGDLLSLIALRANPSEGVTSRDCP